MTKDQIKAAESVRKALEKAGKSGLNGGVYEGGFMLYPKTEDKEQVIADLCRGVECNGVQLFTPSIALDGGEGV